MKQKKQTKNLEPIIAIAEDLKILIGQSLITLITLTDRHCFVLNVV